MACGNPSAMCYACCGGEKEMSFTFVEYKCRLQGGFSSDDSIL